MVFTLAKRLAFFIRQQKHLRVLIGTPERAIDHSAINLVMPSHNREINHWLDRSNVNGVIRALDSDRFYYTDATTGETTQFFLPAMPRAATDLIEQLGF